MTLGVVCNQAPLQYSAFEARHKALSRAHQFLAEEAVQRIGEQHIFCFTETRHCGVVDSASEGLQLLCERLLPTSSFSLRSLPERWAMNIVRRIERRALRVAEKRRFSVADQRHSERGGRCQSPDTRVANRQQDGDDPVRSYAVCQRAEEGTAGQKSISRLVLSL